MTRPDRFTGKVALVTGAARGQGRSHALAFAAEGADVIAVDICASYDTTDYPGANPEDLAETRRLVENLGRRIFTAQADVRDADEMRSAVNEGVEVLGRLDVVSANAGISIIAAWDEVTPQIWRDLIDTNLTGAWNTMVASAPHLIAGGGGAIVCTGSTCGVRGVPFFGPYVAAKHGIVGIARSMANELSRHSVRVNVVHPTGVGTVMVTGMGRIGALIDTDPRLGVAFQNALPVDRVTPADISSAVLYLCSDEARYVTGTELAVDAGCTNL